MYLVVNYYVNDLNPASSSIIALPQMLLAVLLGVSIYIASITLFWLLSSKPSGAESAVLGEIRHRLFAIPNEPDRRQ
jgi:hypothetical protein